MLIQSCLEPNNNKMYSDANSVIITTIGGTENVGWVVNYSETSCDW